MISEMEILTRVTQLKGEALHRWIAFGWLKPARAEAEYLFDEADVARAHLICDLRYDMAIAEEEIGMVLSLLDQLHDARRLLRVMASAVREQPEAVREEIMSRVQALLASP